jgi:glycosyltransferase involved in cell wall biosynthesis
MKIETSPLISVVIPTYNHADFLKVAITSVVEQTYKNFEVIIVDNNSNDHTNEVVYSFNDDRIHLYKINNNGIIAASRNLGVDHAKGDWIAYLDSDDYWYPTRLQCLVDSMNNDPNYDIFSTDEYKYNKLSGKKTKLIYGPLKGQKYRSLLLFGNRLSPSASLVRKEFLLQNDVRFNESHNFVTVEDYDYWLQLALLNARFKFIHSFEGEYLVHGGNSSGQMVLHKSNLLSLLKHHIFNVQEFDSDREILWRNMQEIVSIRWNFQYLKSGELVVFFKAYLMSLKVSPYFVCRWVLYKFKFFLENMFAKLKIL